MYACMCVCMYVCIYICIYIYIRAYIYMYIYIYIGKTIVALYSRLMIWGCFWILKRNLRKLQFHDLKHFVVTNKQGSHRVWKTWKNYIFWKSHGKAWEFENSSKVMELKKSHTDKLSTSIGNLALIRFVSRLISCIHSNTSDYELLGEFETNPLVYCYWFLI